MTARRTHRRGPSRRAFLQGAGGAAIGASMLGMSAATAAPVDDYRALVCILLAGGNDAFNMLVPGDDVGYREYADVRSDLALSQDALLPLAGTDEAGRPLAVHPALTDVRALHDAGDLAFVANLGTLVGPVDARGVEGGAAAVPLGLFSHSDQIAQWQTAVPDARIASGWGGRAADLLGAGNGPNAVPMGISLSGTNVFQSGQRTDAYAIEAGEEGAPGIEGYGGGEFFGERRTAAIDRMLAGPYAHVLRELYAQKLRSAIDDGRRFSAALRQSPSLAQRFSATPVSAALAQIARVIGARGALGARRQTFFLQFGGWDHHDEVLRNQQRMLAVLSRGLAEFRGALEALGVFDRVTTFTISEFGRTLTSNGRGSDHGWGGHQLVMGGAVRGARTFGTYPDLTPSSPLALERGIIVPTLSVDSYFAELAAWFGVADSDLPLVLPNVRRFVPTGTRRPLGFLRA